MNKDAQTKQSHLGRCIIFMLKPLVRILIKSGVGFADFAEWCKFAYVDVIEKEFTVNGKAQSTSRISILSGLHRKEVARIRKELSENKLPDKTTPANRAERVINAWLRDPIFASENNIPKELPLSSDNNNEPSFENLVKTYSGDIHSSTVLDELTRIKAVETTKGGLLRLSRTGYIPASNRDQLDIVSQSTHDLLETLRKNIDPDTDETLFQRSVAYCHLSEQNREEFKKYSEKENEKLLLKLNKWLAQRDMSIAEQEQTPSQFRVGVGIYNFEEPSA